MPNKFPVPPTTNKSSVADRNTKENGPAAFRECLQRYQDCLEYRDGEASTGLNEAVENYILDFELSAKRSLNSGKKFEVFRMLYLESHTAEDCCRSMHIDRFTLAQTSRDVESAVGDTLIRRGLFPLNRYFGIDGSASGLSNQQTPSRRVA